MNREKACITASGYPTGVLISP